MEKKHLTFDQVFKIWLDNEIDQVEGRNLLPVALEKGFTSITEWRLATALNLGMDTKQWTLEEIINPAEVLPDVIIGPYPGWSRFFDNKLETSFAQAMEISEFFEWCKIHDRVVTLSEKFPLPTFIILFRKPDGKLIHIEGGHRMCAVAYANKVGKPIEFEGKPSVMAAIADITEDDIKMMQGFLKRGTDK